MRLVVDLIVEETLLEVKAYCDGSHDIYVEVMTRLEKKKLLILVSLQLGYDETHFIEIQHSPFE